MEKAGYGAALVERARAGGTEDRVRDLWRRLVVALLLGVPVADLSITLVLVPSLRFPGWQWVLLAMTLPVVTWCAWPFHRKALVAARHGASSMDTLVSLGVITAAGWSCTRSSTTAPAARPTGAGGCCSSRPARSIWTWRPAVTMFVLAGRLFEAKARRAAGDALRALAAGRRQAGQPAAGGRPRGAWSRPRRCGSVTGSWCGRARRSPTDGVVERRRQRGRHRRR